MGIEVDPDGLLEDREDVLIEKLNIPNGQLTLPCILPGYGPQLDILPLVGVLDLYLYLKTFSDYDKASFRDARKMESYTMSQDGYVRDISCVKYPEPHSNYFGVMGKVKPRTNEQDPITQIYSAWLILDAKDDSPIKSAHCVCKGSYV